MKNTRYERISPAELSEWYNNIIERAGIASHSPTRGCMVIHPYGYKIWEKIKNELDRRFEKLGIQNAYFPLLIPLSFLQKEAEHIQGFAKECAVVTHHRLKLTDKGIIPDEEAKLTEPYVIRPTSETIIWQTFKNWIRSYRDLPLLINQWANVMRWEMRPRLFLRTSEFLWQEGHTAHASEEDAREFAIKILDLYKNFIEEFLCIAVIAGIKSEAEKFAGAYVTYTIEGLMPDKKAIQMSTSHFLAQNFSKAFDVKFIDKDGEHKHPWATSWGVSTRLIGALIMAHGDKKGLKLPPKVAPIQVVIIPIFYSEAEKKQIDEYVIPLLESIKKQGISCKYDDSDKYKPGWKFNEYELWGVPIRIAIGPKDIQNSTIEISRRDTLEKMSIPKENTVNVILKLFKEIEENLYLWSKEFLSQNTIEVKSKEELIDNLQKEVGMVCAPYNGSIKDEIYVKEKTTATIRCIVETNKVEKCVFTGMPTNKVAYFCQNY